MFCTMGEESRMKREKLRSSESLRIRRARGVKLSSLYGHSVLLESSSACSLLFESHSAYSQKCSGNLEIMVESLHVWSEGRENSYKY
jgi:hypothetical protein